MKKFSGTDLLIAGAGGAAVGAAVSMLLPPRVTSPAGAPQKPVGPLLTSTHLATFQRSYWQSSDSTLSHPPSPTALAEIRLGSAVDWSRVADPIAESARVLGVTPASLLVAPRVALTTKLPPMLVQGRAPQPLSAAQQILSRAGISCDGWNAIQGPMRRNYLSSRGFDPNMAGPIDLSCSVGGWVPYPTAIWAPMGLFRRTSYAFDPLEPRQGSIGDCMLISAMSALAWTRPDRLASRLQYVSGTLRATITDPNTGVDHVVDVTDLLPVTSGDYVYFYTRGRAVTWPGVFEKALAKYGVSYVLGLQPTTSDTPDMLNFFYSNCGDMVTVCGKGRRVGVLPYLHGVQWTQQQIQNGTARTQIIRAYTLMLQSYCPNGRARIPIRAGTGGAGAQTLEGVFDMAQLSARHNVYGIVEGHTYAVFGYTQSGGRTFVILRNPWGYDPPGWIDGSSALTGGSELLVSGAWQGLQLGRDGVFGLSIEAFFDFYISGLEGLDIDDPNGWTPPATT